MSLRKKAAQKSRQLGQGMTEYIVITALVALAAIGAFSFFGQSVQVAVGGMSDHLVGGDPAANLATHQGLADTETTTASGRKVDLGTYTSNN